MRASQKADSWLTCSTCWPQDTMRGGGEGREREGRTEDGQGDC